MTMLDLTPAAQQMATLVPGVRDDRLDAATPCSDYTVGDLLDHVGGLSRAFTAAATKAFAGRPSEAPPPSDASRLGDDWRSQIPADLAALGEAWQNPEAWTGMTRAGGIDMPGEVGGLIALNELIVHGWDLARGSGQPYTCDERLVEACVGLVSQWPDDARGDAFGPVVDVAADAPLLDRLIGLTGRDPTWSHR
jgi:uncharacterized protein (TIGR03086 family)